MELQRNIERLCEAILRDAGPSTPHQLSLQAGRAEDLARFTMTFLGRLRVTLQRTDKLVTQVPRVTGMTRPKPHVKIIDDPVHCQGCGYQKCRCSLASKEQK